MFQQIENIFIISTRIIHIQIEQQTNQKSLMAFLREMIGRTFNGFTGQFNED